jgi:chromosome partitioning protein
MGFLSRKKKKPQPVEPEYAERDHVELAPVERAHAVAEEPHPIVEELEQMEQAVPERRFEDDRSYEGGYEDEHDHQVEEDFEQPEVERPVNAEHGEAAVELHEEDAEHEEVEEEDDGRMQAVDLIAPTRLDFLRRDEEQDVAAADETAHAEVIAFANQKGGVAKTTTTLNLAVAFAESGYRVLCIDLDPQGNLTMSQGIDPDKVERSLYDVLVNDLPIAEVIHKREIDIAVASIDLAGAEIAMSTKIGRERTLEKALKEVSAEYDFVCIDTPPSLGLLTINALTAANKVIVPVQCEYLSMRGLVQLQNTLRMIQENLNPDVRIEGILPTMLDTRTIHAKEAVEILEENFGDLVFRSRIRKAIKFAEAPVKGSSVLKYDSGSSAANYYRELAKEVLANGSA